MQLSGVFKGEIEKLIYVHVERGELCIVIHSHHAVNCLEYRVE